MAVNELANPSRPPVNALASARAPTPANGRPPALPSTEGDSPALSAARARLEGAIDLAISALEEVVQSADKDSSRIAAASEILDRVGLVKPREPPAPNTLPAEVIQAALTGLASVFGRGPVSAPGLRDVTPVSEASGGPEKGRKRHVRKKALVSQEAEP